MMVPRALRLVPLLVGLLAAPDVLRAGANTWTGGRPGESAAGARNLVAAHPDNPDVVYAAFGADYYRKGLYRSGDGGRSWRYLRSFEDVTALLVHPASPSTIYVGAQERVADEYHDGVFQSTDGGATWSRVLEGRASVLAGSPADASVILAGVNGVIHKTGDGGRTWTGAGIETLSHTMASLVFDPREPSTAYLGVEGFEYWGLYPGGLFKTTDGGDHWQKTGPEAEGFSAVAVDSAANGALYVASGNYFWGDEWEEPSSLMRSEDGGETWGAAGEDLSEVTVRYLTADPHISGTLYAGTSIGVFRTRDGGQSWTPFGQRLGGVPIRSLAIDGGGRRLLAGTSNGVYGLEIARGPLDVATGPAGESRLLIWADDRLSIGTLDASGRWTGGPPGQPSAAWTAIAIAESGGRPHVLWQDGSGRTALEIVGPAGREFVKVFPKGSSGAIATDISVRADGETDVLWAGDDAWMSIARVHASGAVTDGPVYGGVPGWAAVAIADAPGGDAWALWRATDGRWAASVHHDGAMVGYYVYTAEADWSAEDLAVGADGRPRILRTSPGGLASVVTVDGEGRLAAAQSHSLPGLTPRRIAASADGHARVLFSGVDGHGELVLLNSDNTMNTKQVFHP